MASVNLYVATDMRTFLANDSMFSQRLSTGTLTWSSSDYFAVAESGGKDEFYGNGLADPSGNVPTTGTIFEWAYYLTKPEGGYQLAYDFYELSIAASTVSSLISANDMDGLFGANMFVGADSMYGSNFNDVLLGFTGNDLLMGKDGDDILDGGAGADDMVGQLGNDTYIIDNDGDLYSEKVDEGTDTIRIVYTPSGSSYGLAVNFENLVNASTGGLTLYGNEAANIIIGADLAVDTILGGDGDDYLDGGVGYDVAIGGLGDDIYIVDSQSDFVAEAMPGEPMATGGIDEVRASISFSLAAPELADIENIRLTGTADINATGNQLANLMLGNTGNNVLNGGGGDDIMKGGDGNDVYIVSSGGDRVVETSASGGIDIVKSQISYSLGANVENLRLYGTESLSGIGNALANQIVGNGAENLINGKAGDDYLDGADGSDALYGGIGGDVVRGGDGDDWIEGGADRDTLYGGADADLFVFRAGDAAGLTATTCDRIVDFAHAQGDQIRLNAIDANSLNGAATNDAFTFIGTAAFTGVAGQLRYQQVLGNTYIYGDTNGDGAADLMIRCDGLINFVAGDFLL